MTYIPADTAILNKVELRLANATTANGYNNEFKRIKRAKMTPFKGYDLPACNIYHTGVDSIKSSFGNETKTMLLVVEAHSKTRDDNFIDVANSLAADVVTGLFRAVLKPKLTDDISIALGGIVKSLVFLGHDPFIGQGQDPFCGTVIRFHVIYETNLGDMKTFT